jgi:hypothetical protein
MFHHLFPAHVSFDHIGGYDDLRNLRGCLVRARRPLLHASHIRHCHRRHYVVRLAVWLHWRSEREHMFGQHREYLPPLYSTNVSSDVRDKIKE